MTSMLLGNIYNGIIFEMDGEKFVINRPYNTPSSEMTRTPCYAVNQDDFHTKYISNETRVYLTPEEQSLNEQVGNICRRIDNYNPQFQLGIVLGIRSTHK